MGNPEQDIKWECLDCGKVWYDDYMIYHVFCMNEECTSSNLIND